MRARRELFEKGRACFHCSRSLKPLPRSKGSFYVGFVIEVDGYERAFHSLCVDEFLSNRPPDTDFDSYASYPERVRRFQAGKRGEIL